MTIKEIRERIALWKRDAGKKWNNPAQYFAYDAVEHLLDQLTPDATADEMREWIGNRKQDALRLSEESKAHAQAYWNGAVATCELFESQFGKLVGPWQSYLRFAKEMNHDNA